LENQLPHVSESERIAMRNQIGGARSQMAATITSKNQQTGNNISSFSL